MIEWRIGALQCNFLLVDYNCYILLPVFLEVSEIILYKQSETQGFDRIRHLDLAPED